MLTTVSRIASMCSIMYDDFNNENQVQPRNINAKYDENVQCGCKCIKKLNGAFDG